MSERNRFQLSASVFVILTKGNEVCMLRRRGAGWMDGSFSLPAGGFDDGETIHSAAIREAEEEVGVRITGADLKHVHTLHNRTGGQTGRRADGQTWIGHFFKTAHWQGTPALRELDKHSDLQWAALDALPFETIPYVRQALECIAARRSYSEFGWD